MGTTDVRKHIRKRKNGASVIRKHKRKTKGRKWSTHRVMNGEKQVFVDGFWKKDDYPNAPKDSWSREKLLKEKLKLSKDLSDGLAGRTWAHDSNVPLPPRKLGLLTRRIKHINRILKKKHEQ